ncbi:MAG: hypothetical protein J6C37_06765 [Roseburia sp.]|nr:hypothetical protein [Roseburia sp.]
MDTHKVAVIAGDGIGPEVLSEGVKVLKKVAELDGSFQFDFTHYPWLSTGHCRSGKSESNGHRMVCQPDAGIFWT